MPRILFVASMILTCTESISASEPDFARDVRPILAQYCFKCHGPDDKARKADLRLDVRQTAIDAGVIVPGKPNESELIARIFATEHDKVMPPISTKTSSFKRAPLAKNRFCEARSPPLTPCTNRTGPS